MLKTVDWKNNQIVIIDQTKIPENLEFVRLKNYRQVYSAIKKMLVRGAPAIGVTAALGVVLGAERSRAKKCADFFQFLKKIGAYLKSARPTAVNLFWGIDRMIDLAARKKYWPVAQIKKALVKEAKKIIAEDIQTNLAIGRHGKRIIPSGARILTHCNAGALATVAYGTALGVIRAAREKIKMVYADETRPRLQGARLTVWELVREKIPVTVLCDNMAGSLMNQKKIDLIIVGADRIAANGDTANKIGTYSLAVLAKYHAIPFYVAAPTSTIDFKIKNGAAIPIEERSQKEVTEISGRRIIGEGARILNPAFDVTPAHLITGIITEKGLFRPAELKKIRYDRH